MKNTKTETELLQTIRKWEDLCDESLADAAYWKGQAQNVPELLQIVKAYRNLLRTMASTEGELATFAHIESVLAKAEGVK
jgi:hypothetical protein